MNFIILGLILIIQAYVITFIFDKIHLKLKNNTNYILLNYYLKCAEILSLFVMIYFTVKISVKSNDNIIITVLCVITFIFWCYYNIKWVHDLFIEK